MGKETTLSAYESAACDVRAPNSALFLKLPIQVAQMKAKQIKINDTPGLLINYAMTNAGKEKTSTSRIEYKNLLKKNVSLKWK